MEPIGSPSIRDYFAELPDPRVERTKRHQLLDILTIALCAVICGADSWVEVEQPGLSLHNNSWHLPLRPRPTGMGSLRTAYNLALMRPIRTPILTNGSSMLRM